MTPVLIARLTVWCLGISQLVCWGITYYLIGVFGDLMERDLGWSRTLVYGGFSVALVVMGLSSPIVGRFIDTHGGRRIMVLGSLATASGCGGLALAHDLVTYYAAWVVIGLAMRLTLYDTAFASLARLGGPGASRAIAQITLLGGLASTVFWPVGHWLAEGLGWRGALVVYAVIGLLTIPLHLVIPDTRFDGETASKPARHVHERIAITRRQELVAAFLFAVVVASVSFLNSGMSAHMLPILGALGVTVSAAVWISTLRGIGQSFARLCQVLFGQRLHPLDLNLWAIAMLPVSFAAAFFSGSYIFAALTFSFVYGAGNGLATITRGTLPLVLMDHRHYGGKVGRLLVPGFMLSAAAPVIYAWFMDLWGAAGALDLSLGAALLALAASLALRLMVGVPKAAGPGRTPQ